MQRPQRSQDAGPLVPQQDNAQDIRDPQKILRLGTMVRELLAEARRMSLDEAGRGRLGDIYEQTVGDIRELLPDGLRDELGELTTPLKDGVPTESELRVVHAQLVGWLEGLFHGIQASMFAQQLQDRSRQAADQPGRGTYL